MFERTLDVICAEVKRQFLNGAERIVLTRDEEVIFCEPDDYETKNSLTDYEDCKTIGGQCETKER